MEKAASVNDIVIIYYLLSKRSMIDNHSFQNANKLQKIVIPSSIESIGNYAFSECESLNNIIFASPSSLKSIGNYAFYSCNSLPEITIPKSVTTIGDLAFSECLELKKVVFEEPSSLKTFGDKPFSHCNKLIQFININPCFSLAKLLGKIHLFVKPLQRKDNFEIDVEPDKLVEDLKHDFCQHYNIYEVVILFKNDHTIVRLDDGTLLDYGICEGSELLLITHKFRGG